MMEDRTKPPSFGTILIGFVWNTAVTLLIVAAVLFFSVGSYYYPRTIGLYVVLPYYTYAMLLGKEERKDGAPWPAASRSFPSLGPMRRFLQLKMVASKELQQADAKEKAQFLFAVFPHGANADYRICMDGILPDILPNTASKIRHLAATVLFRIPVVREFALWTRCVDASRKVAERQLRQGRSVLVLPGGQAEQIRTTFGRERVYLASRKGFVKLALRFGVPLVPVYVFGASDMYWTYTGLQSIQLALVKTLGISIPLVAGQWGSWLCPRPVPTTIVFGKPLALARPKDPEAITTEELNAAHAAFVDALQSLFDAHKASCGYSDRNLEIL